MSALTAIEATKQQIYQVIEQLPEERLTELLHFLEQISKGAESGSEPATAPIYQIHYEAISTGVTDLADQHDHYLYKLNKRDA